MKILRFFKHKKSLVSSFCFPAKNDEDDFFVVIVVFVRYLTSKRFGIVVYECKRDSVSSFLNLSEIRCLSEKFQDFLTSGSKNPADQTLKTNGTVRFETQPTVKNFACKLPDCMSKLSECKLVNRILINGQQVCYIFDFKVNQEVYTDYFILQMS